MSLGKLMVSNAFPHLMVTNQIAFNQGNLYSTPELKCMMDHYLPRTDFQIENIR